MQRKLIRQELKEFFFFNICFKINLIEIFLIKIYFFKDFCSVYKKFNIRKGKKGKTFRAAEGKLKMSGGC